MAPACYLSLLLCACLAYNVKFQWDCTSLYIWSFRTSVPTFVGGGWVFLPEASFGLRVLSSPLSVYLSLCVYQSLACPHDNSSAVQARITKFET